MPDAGTSSDGSTSSDTTSTDSGASSTSATSGASADVAGRYIVTFAARVSEAEQAAAIADSGATDISEIAPLRMHAIDASDVAADALRANAAVSRVEADQVRDVQATPSDPEYSNQWSLRRIGWDQAHGNVAPSGSATVAVLDTGIDASHPDLSANVVPGTSVLDGSNGETDANGHGTWMAGIVAAGTDNGIGIAGVGYAGVNVMPVTVLGADGTGIDSDVISGVVYAADHGADVILMSFSNPGYSASLQAAIDYAWSKGAVVVGATGNDSSSTATFPAGDRGVIGVSSTDFMDSLDLSSNYGADTFLAAPGAGIETTAAGGGYATISGTSAAAAEVAGAAALLRANDSSASNGVIVGRLARNADAAGTSDQTGNGRLNLARAIADTSVDPVEPVGSPPVGGGGPFVGPYVIAAKTLTVAINGTGTGTVNVTDLTDSTKNFSCTTATGPCPQSVGNSDNITMTQTAASGSTFGGWSGACTGTGACSFGMVNVAQTVTATFNVPPNPAPTTTLISPTSRFAGDGAFTLTVNGTNFVSSSVVRWAGSDRVTTFVSSTELTAAIPATDLATTGSKAITVFNPAPGGGTSNSQTLTVNANPVPTTTSIAPTTRTMGGGAFTLTIDGTNFVGNSVVRVNGAARTTTFVSSTELTASIPATDTAATGTRSITVFNPTPGGGTSNAQTLTTAGCTNLICIDGNMSDWAAVTTTPSYPDNTTDAGGGSGDITAIRITSANGNLYVRWDETLTSNRNMVASDGFSITVDANRDGTPDSRGWVTFDSSGVPTVQVERPFGTFTIVGSAQQSCNFSPCSNGAAASIEAAFPLSAFNPTGALIGLQTETRASASTNSSVKDCVPGPIACNGYFNLDTDTGTVTVTVGHVTTTTLNCPDTTRTVGQTTSTCTVTVIDTGVDTNNVSVTKANPTGTVNFLVSGGTGTFTPASCTLSPSTPLFTDRSTCTLTYTPNTIGTGAHTLTASYAGDTAPIQFASSSNTDSLTVTPVANASISGTVYNDADGSGTLTGGEAGLGGVTVFIDSNDNGSFDTGEPTTTSSSAAGTPGQYSFTGLTAGTYKVKYAVPTGYANTGANPQTAVLATSSSSSTGNDFFARRTTSTAVALTTGNSPSAYGDSLTFTATVTSLSDANPTSGTVTFKDGATTLCTTSLSGSNTATCSPSFAAGPHSLTAEYGGTTSPPGFSGSTSSALSQTVTKASLSVTADAIPATAAVDHFTKTYGDPNPSFSVRYDGFVNGDTAASLGGTLTYSTLADASSNVGSYAVTPSGQTSSNYTISYFAGTLDITKRSITVTAATNTKTYDGTTSALATPTITSGSLAFSDTPNFSEAYGNKNVGTGKTLIPSGSVIDGNGGNNYAVTFVNNTTGVINARPITVTAATNTKTYDGTTSAAATPTVTSGVIQTGDTANFSELYANKDVGTGKTLIPSGSVIDGNGGNNYAVTFVNNTTGVVNARPITVTAATNTKTYDGTTSAAATPTVTSGVIQTGDTANFSELYANKDGGTGKTLIPSGSVIDGNGGNNYTVTFVNNTTGVINKAPLSVEPNPKTASRQYSDPNPAYAPSYTGFVNGETASALATAPTCSTTATPLGSQPSTTPYPVTCAGGVSTNYAFSYVAGALTVTKEDASLDYTGDTVGLTGTTGLTLRATVWDSAAAGSGFTGDSTIGDIAKMYIAFDIYNATSCGTGTPTATKTAQVSDTGTLGDGIGTATSTYASSSEASYCIVVRLIGSLTASSVNAWYQANNAIAAVITFYNNSGQFVTGGGWVLDPAGGGNGHGNFGFNARYNKSGSPQGQMVYVYRGLYNGVLADYRIKSNSLTSLTFACWNGSVWTSCPLGNTVFPARATLAGKSTIQINRASDGYVLYSDGNSTFSATVEDSGQSSGIGSDKFAVTVYDKNSVLYKQVGVPTPLYLQGGNVVIHPSK
jgi:hypothetical protein